MKKFQTEFVEKLKTHILCSTTLSENRAFMKKMWKNIAEEGRPQMIKWHMRIACWIPKATNTHTGCVKLTAFQLQQ
jgi:hypothetical protein